MTEHNEQGIQRNSMMILEKIKSEGLAHLSYILGDGDEAIVVEHKKRK